MGLAKNKTEADHEGKIGRAPAKKTGAE